MCQRSLRKEVAAVTSELEALQERATDLAGNAKRRCGRSEEEPDEPAAEIRGSLEHGSIQQLSSKSLGNESSLEGATRIEALLCASRERLPRVGTGQPISSAPAANRGQFASAARRARLGQPRQVPNTSRSMDHLHSRGPSSTVRGSRRGSAASPSSTSMSASVSAPIWEAETESPAEKSRSPSDGEGQHAAFLNAYARHMQGFARKIKRSPRSSSW